MRLQNRMIHRHRQHVRDLKLGQRVQALSRRNIVLLILNIFSSLIPSCTVAAILFMEHMLMRWRLAVVHRRASR
jgi:hypothetical protein